MNVVANIITDPTATDIATVQSNVEFLLRHLGPMTLVVIHPDDRRAVAVWVKDAGDTNLPGITERNQSGRNIYFSANEPFAGLNQKARKQDIAVYRTVYADVDAKDGRTMEQCLAAIERLALQPSFIIMTGGGYQPLWVIDPPLPASPGDMLRVESLSHTIAGMTGGDAVQNVDRILRLPGTINHPNKRKRDAGRTPCMAGLVDLQRSVARYTIEALEDAFPPATTPSRDPRAVQTPAGPPVAPAAVQAGSQGTLGPAPAFIAATAGAGLNAHALLPPDGELRQAFAALTVKQQNAMLAAIAAWPEFTALADLERAEWLSLLFGFADADVLGATEAWALALGWCKTSPRFLNDADFDKDWRSFKPPQDKRSITVGTLIWHAAQLNFDVDTWFHPADAGGSFDTTSPAKVVPDLSVLRDGRRAPPTLPLAMFGADWKTWIEEAADAAACPPDYVMMPLLAFASVLIGNARWPEAWTGWTEPPHLWLGVVGDSGSGKSPGADCLQRDVIPTLVARMQAGHPAKMQAWRTNNQAHTAATEAWKKAMKVAVKNGQQPPLAPPDPPMAPHEPCLSTNDATIESVATLLAHAAPKGMLVIRDELVGWIAGMRTYNDAGREFWIECFGGRSYKVDRKNNPHPIEVDRLVTGVYGSTQPDKLAALLRGDPDDGLFSRVLWSWPEPRPFQAAQWTPRAAWATDALDRLRLLDLIPGMAGLSARPLRVPLEAAARAMLVTFAQDMQRRQAEASGLMRSAFGKARGQVLRISLVLEYLWWCAGAAGSGEPTAISREALACAIELVGDYFVPMAERVYGDAAVPEAERNATTLARWIARTRPAEVHVQTVKRKARLERLREAGAVKAAAQELVELGWLLQPSGASTGGRPRGAFVVNPVVWELLP